MEKKIMRLKRVSEFNSPEITKKIYDFIFLRWSIKKLLTLFRLDKSKSNTILLYFHLLTYLLSYLINCWPWWSMINLRYLVGLWPFWYNCICSLLFCITLFYYMARISCYWDIIHIYSHSYFYIYIFAVYFFCYFIYFWGFSWSV